MRSLSRWFGDLSLTRKLTVLGVVAAFVSVTTAGVALLAFDLSYQLKNDITGSAITADVIGLNSAAALVFDDANAAGETLSALRSNAHIITAAVLATNGRVLARCDRDRDHPHAVDHKARTAAPWQEINLRGGSFALTRPIVLNGETIGTVFVESDVEELVAHAIRYVEVLGVV